MKKSWKTTVAGIGGILAAVGTGLQYQFDNDPATTPDWGIIVAACTAAFGLIFARDNGVSSEDAGAKK